MITEVRNALAFVALTAMAAGCGSASPPATETANTEAETGAATEQQTATPPGTAPDANMDRADIPDRYRWDLSPLFADDAAFSRGLAEAEAKRAEVAACRGTLRDPARLEACLDLYFATRLLTNRLTLYAGLLRATDVESSEAQARVGRAQAAMDALMSQAAEQRTEILAMSDAVLDRAFSRRPGLAVYRPYIQQMRRRRGHVLGAEAERVLSLAGDNQWAEVDLNEIPSDHERTFQAFLAEIPLPTITDEDGQSVQLTLSSYGKYRGSSDRRVRRDTVEGFFASLRSFDQTLASMLGGQARLTVFLARARGYDTALDAYLDRDEVSPDIYRNLVRVVEDNVAPLHRYMRFRKERAGVPELHIYDLYTPIVPAVERRITFDDSRGIVAEALAPMGEQYGRVLAQGFDPENGWIDVYPHQGKESGAFSASIHGTHPFVFLNDFEELDDLMTLAHELGHALHSDLAMQAQPYVTSSYVPVIAETASTFNEVLVIRHLIERSRDDDERLYLLGVLVEMIRTTIYRQALFASFELAFHSAVEEGTPITAELLDQIYVDLLRRYYGDALTLGENDGIEWAYIPHFYYKFYMYSYAMGLCAGIALGDRVRAGGAEARDAYLGMLAAGSSRPPLELFRGAGIDPSQPAAVEAAAQLLDASLSQMEEILAQRETR